MFLEEYLNNYDEFVVKMSKDSTTYSKAYLFWREHLFERVMKLFVWEDLPDEIPAKEIEQRLLVTGKCAITKITVPRENIKNELTAMNCHLHGVTKYYDEKKNLTVHCPIYTGTRKIGKDCVLINNTTIRNSIMPLIHHYACLLGHTDVSLVDKLVNTRTEGGIPIVTSEKQKQSVAQFQSKIYNGQYGAVTDSINKGIDFLFQGNTGTGIEKIMETRERILKSFYSAIGIRSAYEKNNNTIKAEVESDTSLLQINLADMIDMRKKGCDEMNKMFGTNASVHIAEEIDYGTENERMKFANLNEVHVLDKGGNNGNS